MLGKNKEAKMAKKAEKLAKRFPYGNKTYVCNYSLKGYNVVDTIEYTSKPKENTDYTNLKKLLVYNWWIGVIRAKYNRNIGCGRLKADDILIIDVKEVR